MSGVSVYDSLSWWGKTLVYQPENGTVKDRSPAW
jgi:hypothetical protein